MKLICQLGGFESDVVSNGRVDGRCRFIQHGRVELVIGDGCWLVVGEAY